MRKIVFILLLLCFSIPSQGQSKKKIKEAEIKVKITWKVDYASGKEKKIKEKEEYFTTEGELREVKDYWDDGSLKSDVKFEYSPDGLVTRETYFTQDGNVDHTVVYNYNGKLRTEKQLLDCSGKLVSKKIYEYLKQ